MKQYFEQYENLREVIDKRSSDLSKKHSKHMSCKAGCDLCCMDYSIFPIEFYYIAEQLKKSSSCPGTNTVAKPEECIFLVKQLCTIYKYRPIICRTHGLPLLYMSDDGNWELSACHLNFTQFDMSEFTDSNTYAQDKFNSKLFLLNKDFIQCISDKIYKDFDLVPIRKLIDFI